MTFGQLALSNVRGSALRYAAFFLSSVFSVLLFFMYAQFLMHPDVTGGYIYGGSATRIVLTICAVLVAVFAFFFVLYSSGAFLRARNREFGLLTLLGTTRAQLRKLIWLENTFISLAAIGVGIGLGLLFSRLFLLGISRVLNLEEPIRFLFVPTAILLTAVGFFVLFQVVTLASSLFIGRQSVVELMRTARKPRSVPRASGWLALLGAVLVAAGYAAALIAEGGAVVIAFVPVVALVVVGCNLLFVHGSVKLLQLVRRAEGSYLRGTRMLVVSQLLFRVRDNAQLFASIASLSAVVLSAAGTFYIMNQQLAALAEQAAPQQLAFLVRPEADAQGVQPEAVDAVLANHGVAPSVRLATTVHEVRYRNPGGAGPGGWLLLVGESELAALAKATGVTVEPADAPTILGYEDGLAILDAANGVSATPVELLWELSLPGAIRSRWWVVPDAELASLPMVGREYAPATLWTYDWPAQANQVRLEKSLSGAVAEAPLGDVASSFVGAQQVRETFGLSMFAGVFVSLLFFIGAGSLIYFKLFTELDGDRRLFDRLRRLGITPGETSRTVTAQIAILFLLPFAVGGLHAFVALDALGALLMVNVVQYSLIVVGLFALVQFAFFLLTRWTYLRALAPARG